MIDLIEGLNCISKQIVTKELLASSMGSGDMDVFATPAMIAMMENAAMLCVDDCLEEGATTVGISMNATHIRATALNKNVDAVATVTNVDGRKITFDIIAHDEVGIIGEAKHERFVVNKEKFLSKL